MVSDNSHSTQYSYWRVVWNQFQKHRIGFASFIVVLIFATIGLYAPFFASSKPFIVEFEGHWYFPLFRYLFFEGFFTKPIDIFYNILMFVLPAALLLVFTLKKHRKTVLLTMLCLQGLIFLFVIWKKPLDPASDPNLEKQRQEALQKRRETGQDPLLAPITPPPSWAFDLQYMNDYAQLNLVLRDKLYFSQHQKLLKILPLIDQEEEGTILPLINANNIPSMWAIRERQEETQLSRLQGIIQKYQESYSAAIKQLPGLTQAYLPFSAELMNAQNALQESGQELTALQEQFQGTIYQPDSSFQDKLRKAQENYDLAKQRFDQAAQSSKEVRSKLEKDRNTIQTYVDAKAKLDYLIDRRNWVQGHVGDLHYMVMPLLRPFHWEDDAGGTQNFNQHVKWWELTRINRKDLVSALIFGMRVSMMVGITAVVFALAIGIPLGAIAGYFGGKSDLLICRLMEIWEAMPTFFMLLLVVAITQSKSIFLVIAVLGIFGWISIARFIRGEVLKQRNFTYVEACHSMGFRNRRIIFLHILPNAIPPVLTLLPFAVMAAIISEAGLSFLGLGEEGSSSWGVLMDEGRTAFPAESYLLWPPAFLLTILLVAIALVGDALRDAIDPKLR